jgi:hypothetical protein
LELGGQNQTLVRVGWLKMDFTLDENIFQVFLLFV